MAKNNNSTSAKKSSFLKILWWALTPILITLIVFGTLSIFSKKESAEVSKKVTSSPSKSIPTKPATWIFQIKADPEVIIVAKGKGVNQAPLKEFKLTFFSQTDKELRFKYKTSTGKLVDVLLDKKKPDDTHYFGMADLPDPPKGRKMMLWLKTDGEGFEGTTLTWDGVRWYPTVSAFLKKS